MINFDKKEFILDMKKLFRSKYFYMALIVLLMGFFANFLAQSYLYQFESKGHTLPVLSDIILDHIPYYDLSNMYDFLVIFSGVITLFYIARRKKYNEVPFFILVFGLFYILRGIFIILTPLGNPANFAGTHSIFNGFSRYDLGVYPSGHTGSVFLYSMFSKGIYRFIICILLVLIILSLLLSRGHYSIDIFSGILFCYAIYSFGRRYFNKFKL